MNYRVENKGDLSQFQSVKELSENNLVLSLFSGLDILGMGFQKEGFCTVSAGDIITGKDIRDFHPTRDKFDGVVGGSPCQDFSKLRRIPPTGYGLEMISEFERIVIESNSEWFLMENVAGVPDVFIEGYQVQRFRLSPNDFGFEQSRNRHFQFGSKRGFVLLFERQKYNGIIESCLTASKGSNNIRNFEDYCKLQGFEETLDLPDFTKKAQFKLVGNGVHLGVAREVAKSIRESTYRNYRYDNLPFNICPCGCGEILTGKQKMKTELCRKIMQLNRERAAVNQPGE